MGLNQPVRVLVVDDQEMVFEKIRSLFYGESVEFAYVADPTEALDVAEKFQPTVILLDLIMPQMEGLTLLKFFRAKTATKEVPVVVLSMKEEDVVKAEAFSAGANDYLVKLPGKEELVARVLYHSQAYHSVTERRMAYDKLEQSQEELKKDLADAACYVQSLLPSFERGEVKSEWKFVPSVILGGDIFDYHWISNRYFVFYLLDVCGHGVGAALLSVTLSSVLKNQSLPGADFLSPAEVLRELNRQFPMESHNEMFFTIWYGVYDKETGLLTYSSGGHPPAFYLPSEEAGQPFEKLSTTCPVVGVDEGLMFHQVERFVGPRDRLLLFSDGLVELKTEGGRITDLSDFEHLVRKAESEKGSLVEQIWQRVNAPSEGYEYFDDCSLLLIQF